jgi:hypothetical protein
MNTNFSIPSYSEKTGSPAHFPVFWVLLGLGCAIAISLAPIPALLNLFHDDSFFYMVIARNHAAGLGYSFDGLNQTNGFHLLWLWMLSAVGSVATLSGEQGIRIVVFLQSLFSISAALLYVHLLSLAKVRTLVLILFFFAYVFLCTFADIGQESALFGFLIALLISRILTAYFVLQERKFHHENSSNAAWIQGTSAISFGFPLLALSALAVLARLDAFFILGGIALALGLCGQKKGAMAVMAGVLIGICVTMSFNYLHFAHAYSISSWLKSGFDLDKLRQISIPGLAIRVMIVLGLLGVALYRYREALHQIWVNLGDGRLNQKSEWSLPAILTLCAFLSYGAYFLVLFVQVSALGSWYFNQAMGLALFLYALSTIAISSKDSISTRAFNVAVMPLVLALLMGASLWVVKFGWANSSGPTKEMGEWLAANTPTDAVIFQRDGAGAVSYFARRHIINGDGLVNNMPYQVMLRSGKLCQYLQEQKVQYLVTNVFVNQAGNLQDFIYLWTKGVDSIALTNVSPSKALYASPSAPIYRVFKIADAASYCQ